MANNRWLSRLLAGTRGRIVDRLRRAPATIVELASELDLSANAVRSHLAALERDGLVSSDVREPQGVGKPAHRYRLTADAGALTPKAYDAMLDVVLDAARERGGARGYAQLLDAIAARLGGPGGDPRAPLAERLAGTRALLASIGAAVEVERRGPRLRMTGTDCPLSGVVASHPELCSVLAGAVGRRLGVPVIECCDRDAALPRCCFEALLDAA